jgi:hypothetical protein
MVQTVDNSSRERILAATAEVLGAWHRSFRSSENDSIDWHRVPM